MCVFLLLSVFVCTASVRQPVMFERQKTEVNLRFSMFGCVIVFLCELVYVCVLLSVFVCTASVRQPLMFERQKT